jgi:hypothetical protein
MRLDPHQLYTSILTILLLQHILFDIGTNIRIAKRRWRCTRIRMKAFQMGFQLGCFLRQKIGGASMAFLVILDQR